MLLLRPPPSGGPSADFGVPELLSVAAFVAPTCPDVPAHVLDLAHDVGDRSDLARRLDAWDPVLAAVWVDSGFALWSAMALGRFLRARWPDVPLVAWGPCAAGLAGDLRHVFDRVVPGEGEHEIAGLVEQRLAGDRITPGVAERRPLDDPDALPQLPWAQLTCLETAPMGSRFRLVARRTAERGPSPARVIGALERLASMVDLSRFVVEVPLPRPGPERGVLLQGLAATDVATLGFVAEIATDLDDDDAAWMARARFGVHVALHSGSPHMLRLGWGILDAERHLAAVRSTVRRAQEHRVPWTVGVTVGHPGETLQTAIETRSVAESLFTAGPASHGWLAVRPFRLQPGSLVHAQRETWEASYGARFPHPAWWRDRYDQALRSAHLDPSAVFDHEGRVRWMHDEYGPLLDAIHERASSVDGHDHPRSRLLRRAQLADRSALSRSARDRKLAWARAARQTPPGFPVGLPARNEGARRLEAAVRSQVDRGRRGSERLLRALFEAPPSRYLAVEDARVMLDDRIPEPPAEGWAPTTLGLGTWLVGLRALAPQPGDRALDLAARSPHMAAVLADLVGPYGEVVAVAPDGATADSLRAALVDRPGVSVLVRGPADRFDVPGRFDAVWLGAALPRVPEALRALLAPDGRAVLAVGPRDEAQAVLLVGPDVERTLTHDRWPVWGGAEGWLPWPRDPRVPPVDVQQAEGPARFFAVLAAADLGPDRIGEERRDAPWARVMAQTWPTCAGRVVLPRLGLAHLDVRELVRALRWPPPALGDRPGRALCAAVATGLEAGREEPLDGFGELPEATIAQIEAFRAEVWAPQGLRPPSLVLLDVPALGPRSRAANVGGSWRVATSLAMPAEHVLL
ncbi:MAG: hypothetical protein AAF602_04850, partial [Myxococcota bacterium]